MKEATPVQRLDFAYANLALAGHLLRLTRLQASRADARRRPGRLLRLGIEETVGGRMTHYVIREGKVRGKGRYWRIGGWTKASGSAQTYGDKGPLSYYYGACRWVTVKSRAECNAAIRNAALEEAAEACAYSRDTIAAHVSTECARRIRALKVSP